MAITAYLAVEEMGIDRLNLAVADLIGQGYVPVGNATRQGDLYLQSMVKGSPDAGSVTANEITDATAVGKAVLTAADQATARTAIGAVTIGTVAGTALAATGKAATAGIADTATKLASARAISLTGGATGTQNFDGSGPAVIAVTLATPATAVRGGVLQAAAIANGDTGAPADPNLINTILAALRTAGVIAP